MKAFAASPCIAFLSVLLLLSLAMAEKNQQKEIIPQEQPDLPMAEHGGLVSDGVNEGASNHPSALRRAPRREWSEVVGLTVEEAKKKIQEDMPMANFQVVPPDCFVTMDFNPRRVRLYVDDSNKVARPPKTG